MFYDKLLEFPKILNILSTYASLDETKMNIMDLAPSCNKDEVAFVLKETDEARESTVKLGKLDIFPFDIHDTLNRLRMSAPLNVYEFLEILKFVDDIARVMT